MNKMSKELENKESGALTESADMSAWGDQTVTSNDIVIEKILFQQFMSEKVKSSDAIYGELRGTLNNEKFGDLNNALEFIPFHVNKFWIEFDRIKNKNGTIKTEYREIVPIH